MSRSAQYGRDGQEITGLIPRINASGTVTQPAVGATVAIGVSDTSSFFVGQPVIMVGGRYIVAAIGLNQLTLTNTGASFNAAPAAAMVVNDTPIWPADFGGAMETGVATLIAGTSGAITTRGTAASVYSLTPVDVSGTSGFLRQTAGANSLVIDSENALDTRTIRWARLS